MSPSISVLVSTFHPFPTISFSLPESTPISTLPVILSPLLPLNYQSLSTSCGKSVKLTSSGDLLTLKPNGGTKFLQFRLVPKVLGGKGGFGSQLRAAGGRMSSQKTQNNDSCRDLSGRRLSTIKEAQKLAAAIAAEPERQAAKQQEAEDRLAALNQEIARLDALVNGTDEGNVKKRRLNDSHQLAQSKEGIEKVRSAVAMAMLKKKKKQHTQKKQALGLDVTTSEPIPQLEDISEEKMQDSATSPTDQRSTAASKQTNEAAGTVATRATEATATSKSPQPQSLPSIAPRHNTQTRASLRTPKKKVSGA